MLFLSFNAKSAGINVGLSQRNDTFNKNMGKFDKPSLICSVPIFNVIFMNSQLILRCVCGLLFSDDFDWNKLKKQPEPGKEFEQCSCLPATDNYKGPLWSKDVWLPG